MDEQGTKEERIRKITQLYYSRKDIQKALFEFSKNREIAPSYMMESFGKRPDSFQYQGDIFELVKKGATSFHCSEELWHDPLAISTGMTEKKLAESRLGWDLLLDIDSKYLDYSKIMAELIVKVLQFHGVKNIGIKFSVAGDTPILVKDKEEISLIPISEAISLIKKGRKLGVLSLDKERKLKFSKIYNFLKHKDIIYEIKHTQSTIPLKVTGHHSVFILDKSEIIQKKVTEIKKGDFLISYNSRKNPFSEKEIKVTHEFESGKNQHSMKKVSKELRVTPNLMRLIGYFLAEGHVTNIINQVGFTFNKDEEEYIKDVTDLLYSITGKNPSIRHPNSGSTQILIHSKEWANFFDFFCGKKKNKHVPPLAFKIPSESFLEMLKGYIRGDGYKRGEYGIVIKSVSKRLITEMLWLCKLNNISCNMSKEQNREHKMPNGPTFRGNLVYSLRIPKSELENLEFYRKRNKFSPYAGDRLFPTDGLREVYKQIKPKMFNSHRAEQMTLYKKKANLQRIKKVLDWFDEFKSKEYSGISVKIIENYKKLFDSDICIVEIKDIFKRGEETVYDVSVEETEAFFGNYYPLLLHNSGSKGFHIIVPWKAFPKAIRNTKTSDMFPEWPRIITKYIMEMTKKELIEKITQLNTSNAGGTKYVKDFQASEAVVPDLILVSPRHLFRMPYSLHEKTALASVVLKPEQLSGFQPKDADPLKAEIRNFSPDSREGEASELLREALDWYKSKNPEGQETEKTGKSGKEFKPIVLKEISEKNFPPSIQKILLGIPGDGRKRALFIILNFLRSVGMERKDVESMIAMWNSKNEIPLKEGYIKTQLIASYRGKPIPPPNFDKDYYSALGIKPTEEELRTKNPLSYMVRKTLRFSEKNDENQEKPYRRKKSQE